ncbi:MAG: SIR2 family protein [Synergistaceae bacterium]|nr:SIR2 family protein [Synergistaceae bacterium]
MSEGTSLYFDPSETVRGIQQLLVSDKKKIAFFFGAGTSFAGRTKGLPYVPAIAEMTEKVETEIDRKYTSALADIKAELANTPIGFNVETLLSNIEDKIRIIGLGTLNNLKKNDFVEFENHIKDIIRQKVSIHEGFDENTTKQLVQHDFAKWIKAADRKHAVEIFTTNYDYLIEIGLESLDVPYYDGFTGSYEPFFNATSLEDMDYLPRQTKLWKIHGSLGLHESKLNYGNKIIRKNSDSEVLLVYPSMLKYSNSKKMPYAAYMDRLYSFLKQDDAVLFICGYSFGDEHINERIFSALSTNSTSHVFAFYYDVVKENDGKKYMLTEDSKLVQIATENRRVSVLGMRNAVLGARRGTWKLKREPDKNDTLNVALYFDEDAPFNDIGMSYEKKGDEFWTGEGEFSLPDFVRFVIFLKEMIHDNEWENVDNG